METIKLFGGLDKIPAYANAKPELINKAMDLVLKWEKTAEVQQITNDQNGNERYIMHYTCFITKSEHNSSKHIGGLEGFTLRNRMGVNRARSLGWKQYVSSKKQGYMVITASNIKAILFKAAFEVVSETTAPLAREGVRFEIRDTLKVK